MAGRNPSPRILRRLLDYNPSTGELTWRRRPVWMFAEHPRSGSRACTARMWNSRYAGKPALYTTDTQGYKLGRILVNKQMAHRVIMAMVNDEWPPEQVDHINGIRGDNRLSNLRTVTAVENCKNKRITRRNSSGRMGVCRVRKTGKWRSSITEGGRVHFLGSFHKKQDAIAARIAAEKRFGFHKNHGRTGPCQTATK